MIEKELWDKEKIFWQGFLKDLEVNTNFFTDFDTDSTECDNFLRNHNIQLTGGMCRIVFISDEHDTVIKIDKTSEFNDTEIGVFKKAIEENVEQYFCQCEIIDKKNDASIELMEKIEPMEDACSEDSEDEDFGSGDWVRENFLDAYDDLITFIDNENINDIHIGNIGYKNNQLKILDFAGY